MSINELFMQERYFVHNKTVKRCLQTIFKNLRLKAVDYCIIQNETSTFLVRIQSLVRKFEKGNKTIIRDRL